MSTLIVDELYCDPHLAPVPLTQLGHRIVKINRQNYDGGQWNPNTTYNWAPGMFMDYTPLRTDTRIRAWLHMSFARTTGSSHCMSHFIFYANGVEQGRHTIAGQHLEGNGVYVWDFASWGTSNGRIGYQSRAYADDNHEVRLHCTNWWDGGGSIQTCRSQMIVEEYLVGV